MRNILFDTQNQLLLQQMIYGTGLVIFKLLKTTKKDHNPLGSREVRTEVGVETV